MNKINHFEDFAAWKKARELCKTVSVLTKKDLFNRDLKFSAQVRDSSGTIMDSIAEGSEQTNTEEFVRYLINAKSSCGGLKSQLHRAMDLNYINKGEFASTYSQAEEISLLIQSQIQELKSQQ
ncbi:MAG: four helix bundle protein [Bacteroidota bacterium]|nr:four helix bundle protein [Bacteroidota bacterium]